MMFVKKERVGSLESRHQKHMTLCVTEPRAAVSKPRDWKTPEPRNRYGQPRSEGNTRVFRSAWPKDPRSRPPTTPKYIGSGLSLFLQYPTHPAGQTQTADGNSNEGREDTKACSFSSTLLVGRWGWPIYNTIQTYVNQTGISSRNRWGQNTIIRSYNYLSFY